MNDDVTSVELAGKNTLKVFFHDGKCGWVDFSDLIEKYPEYSPLRDPEGGIDIAPETLYHLATVESK
jgi:hypothetical protein